MQQECFTEQERALLSRYMTNTDQPIFCLKGLSPVVAGALFSRYSRSAKGVRQIFLEEFAYARAIDLGRLDDVESGEGEVDIERENAFYARVLGQYGDESIAELGWGHVACEGVSVLAAKEIESSRLGIAMLEKSTRYVLFDDAVDGRYQYVRPREIAEAGLLEVYEAAMDRCFGHYSRLVSDLQIDLRDLYPQDGETSDRAYAATIRAKAADIARSLLPVGHTTNLGLAGNGRALEWLLVKLAASPLDEAREVGRAMQRELGQVMHAFVQRASSAHGQDYSQYLAHREQMTGRLTRWLIPPSRRGNTSQVNLVWFDPDGEAKVIAAMLYPHSGLSFNELFIRVKTMSPAERLAVVDGYTHGRGSRHRHVGSAFELAVMDWEVTQSFGVWKDLQRHRVVSREDQLFGTELGYVVPHELQGTRHEAGYRACLEQAAEAHARLLSIGAVVAQYVLPMAFRKRFFWQLNLRELSHLAELRSTPQGHPEYRRVAQDMARQVQQIYPLVGAAALAFVDYSEVALARLQAEQRTDARQQALAAAG